MKRVFARWIVGLLVALGHVGAARGEKVADLPVPTTYVNDFAHVLSPAGSQKIEDLCLQVHQKANAEIVVVTIKTLDGDQSVDEFTALLGEKWKLGKKGEDRSALYVLVLNPQKLRIETGYGLEGILNDAKVGALLDNAKPFAVAKDYDQAMMAGALGLANVIAADANVTLTETVHQYRRVPAQGQQKLGLGQIVLGIGFVVLLLILVKTGHVGWALILLMNVMGGGGGGGGRNDDSGGGFGGSGGGGSGGGGSSRDY